MQRHLARISLVSSSTIFQDVIMLPRSPTESLLLDSYPHTSLNTLTMRSPSANLHVRSSTGIVNSNCCCHQGRTECCRRSDRRADSIPNLDTNANLTSSSSASDYKAGVAYALKNPNLRHVYRCWSRRMARMGRQLAFVLLDSSIIMRDYPCDIQLQHTSLDVI